MYRVAHIWTDLFFIQDDNIASGVVVPVWPVLMTVCRGCSSQWLLAAGSLSRSLHLTQWTSRQWERAVRGTADHKHDRNTGTRHSPASRPGLRWAQWCDAASWPASGVRRPRGLTRPVMCAQVCGDDTLPLPVPGQHHQTSKTWTGLWRLLCPWSQFVISLLQFWVKRSVDTYDLGVNEGVL